MTGWNEMDAKTLEQALFGISVFFGIADPWIKNLTDPSYFNNLENYFISGLILAVPAALGRTQQSGFKEGLRFGALMYGGTLVGESVTLAAYRFLS